MPDLTGAALQLARIESDQLHLLNRFYKRHGHKGRARAEHRSFALQQQGEIIAALRLEPLPWGQLLRGLWVDKTLRGCGLGARLLQQLHSELIRSPCYCLPFDPQAGFYRKQGFIDARELAPPILYRQWQRYLQRGEQLQLMVYSDSIKPKQ
ncbi:GNAT family N-acetyltransferase [Marinobacterium arenosum]|uniref:GNAT family N-acetyltransferase n=1 Tax=Marinobacterium arenosum TaxID=2862496 RepID=UPI001C9419E8|nr:GNAT family N-acetyltransferase [Marinobacterium arenosum]MBY4678950.1 GNAT family N-acetyltransferase [Marinobacterium arenosum]